MAVDEAVRATPPEDGGPCAALRALDANGLQGSLPDGIRLTEIRPNWDRSSPYLVMHANANLIPGHNDIYSPSFVKFLLTYLNFYLEEKPDETPLRANP
ncbi:MAG: hypothetical protein DMF53_24095 [Acidobacteria bacterium]|nr:MAG: hypothetical protein DMF53_24095 [Acidobacteriota bacterium]